MIEQDTLPPPAPADERRPLPWRAIAVVVVAVIAGSAALGALGGWLWYRWWGPPNTGAIVDLGYGPTWYDLSSDAGLTHQFDGPAQYAVIGLGLGIVLGVLAAVLGRRQALAAMAALVVGGALAAYLSWAVGTAMSPPDPERYATEANLCTKGPCEEYPAAIEVSGWTPFLCWPIGALGGFCAAIAVMSFTGEVRRQQVDQQQAGNWLEPVKSDRSEQSPLL
ncbi:hypothetical protein D0Z08_20955 [Nocardioides immobilis]|uniref:DUF2567 domain-containing protein n=1 Tax=Nocardioides immobilis TaxID=2049295 RepID=A0A417XXV6_9ACTN|nr:hypothetical protein [Nocardioides immobilis]RHW25165.1 hypothetical protein D0Z08_20955 [Nocardioides immobilis]